MTRVAIVGFGFMGKTHYGAWRKCRRAKVVAVCEASRAQLSAKVEGNIAGVADNGPLPADVRIYETLDALLAAGGFDVVDVTLPTPLHPGTVLAALKAGFHVLCEKPMALSLKDCDRMLAAAKAARRQLLVAHCVRFFPENAYVRRLVRSGRYGKVVAADFSRFIAPPKWSPKGADWFLDEQKSGGVLFDVHIHDADYVLGLFGRPESVSSVAHRNGRDFVDHTSTAYRYGDGKVVTSSSSFAAASSFVWEASGRLFLERATVCFGPLFKSPLTVYPDGGRPFVPSLPKETGYEAEIRYFLRQVERGAPGDVLTAEDGRDAVALVLAERKSAASGRACPLRRG